ncbi:Hpt domain-containing protein [Desulfocicer vacuolatum DSM 3385]|uniref:Hpt domain-containing protein n=1 Tax=Desulfocicer vacuolatum DSM 3385 TaxID=1121400 RepID=A0A1W1YNP3_9BACT|nr:Hpt domain-containing protein [Desulfocicer vacuolatum]SMC37787.1 Hpt domain-containing protein [Desulfocicer vacuolatum DSM 3385]
MTEENIDFSTMASNLGFDEDEFKEVAQLLITVSLTDLENLEQGIKENDPDKVKDAAHSIKGAAGNLGFTELSNCAETIENSARSQQINELTSHVMTIKTQLQTISSALSS